MDKSIVTSSPYRENYLTGYLKDNSKPAHRSVVSWRARPRPARPVPHPARPKRQALLLAGELLLVLRQIAPRASLVSHGDFSPFIIPKKRRVRIRIVVLHERLG
ncbi:hypothetical protein EVAR_92049_1 [Eumeta japonica]|uniref:Uncharacterized protein n=1 Tax=Eumeta variegata TaxID=151549 RepID=A0A4C1T0W7_EUMVA|nr:hypothetical protein EVAR_92049_1 [Eumeta japonica]